MMLPRWRRLRLASSAVGLLVGTALVVLAIIAPPAVPSAARGLLIVLAVLLPVGFFGVFTLAGWQRSADAGVTPPSAMARLLGWGLGRTAPILFMFILLGLMFRLIKELDGKT